MNIDNIIQAVDNVKRDTNEMPDAVHLSEASISKLETLIPLCKEECPLPVYTLYGIPIIRDSGIPENLAELYKKGKIIGYIEL